MNMYLRTALPTLACFVIAYFYLNHEHGTVSSGRSSRVLDPFFNFATDTIGQVGTLVAIIAFGFYGSYVTYRKSQK